MGDTVNWVIPGVIAASIAFATSFVSFGQLPPGPIKACASIAVMGDGHVFITDCEGSR